MSFHEPLISSTLNKIYRYYRFLILTIILVKQLKISTVLDEDTFILNPRVIFQSNLKILLLSIKNKVQFKLFKLI